MSQSNNHLEDKIDSIAEDVSDIKVTVAKQEVNLANNTESLKEHMLRTKIAEEHISKLHNSMSFVKGAIAVSMIIGPIIAFLVSSGILKKLL